MKTALSLIALTCMIPLSAMQTPPRPPRGLLSTPESSSSNNGSFNDSFERLYLNSPVVATPVPVRVVASPILVPINTQRGTTARNAQAYATFAARRAVRYNISPNSYLTYVPQPTRTTTYILHPEPTGYDQMRAIRRAQQNEYQAPILPGLLGLLNNFVPERLPRTTNRYLDGSLLSSNENNNNNNSINNEKQG